jgi:hypothetical protein
MNYADLKDPLPQGMAPPTDPLIIVGSSAVAIQLALLLEKKSCHAFVMCPHVIVPSHFDCTKRVDDPLAFLFTLDVQHIRYSRDHFVQSIEYDANKKIFCVATDKETRFASCVVLCSDNEIKKYAQHAKRYNGLFLCADGAQINGTIDDVKLHLQLDTTHIKTPTIEQTNVIVDSLPIVVQSETAPTKKSWFSKCFCRC